MAFAVQYKADTAPHVAVTFPFKPAAAALTSSRTFSRWLVSAEFSNVDDGNASAGIAEQGNTLSRKNWPRVSFEGKGS